MAQQFDAIAESQLVAGDLPTWLEQLRPASFRGVPFQVDSIEWVRGDNLVVREYPFQDLPTVFRMGAAMQELKFSAYVIGADYHLQREALASALSGPGLLMHPTAGVLRVYVAGKFTIRENPTAEGGMARFDLHFVRADARREAAPVVSSQVAATAAAVAGKQAARDAFVSSFKPERKPGWVVEGAMSRLRGALAGVIGPIQRVTTVANEWQVEVNASYRALVNGLDALVSAPRQLADAIANLYRLPSDLSAGAGRDLRAAFAWGFDIKSKLPRKPFEVRVMPPVGAGLVLYGTGLAAAAPPPTPAQVDFATLEDAGDDLIEALAVCAYVEAAAAAELASRDEALAVRSAVHAQLTRLMQSGSVRSTPAEMPASAWHDALSALYGAAMADLQARGTDSVRLDTYTPEGWIPVWVLSHRLYGTARYADELLAMNPHIEHPLLVPPGRPLRIVRH
jgi:prophage DNA circulation protein